MRAGAISHRHYPSPPQHVALPGDAGIHTGWTQRLAKRQTRSNPGTQSDRASSVNVANYNSGSPRGTLNLLGGIIEKYYGPFGTVNGSGVQLTGYGRSFTYDTRMSRGFSPPYFPTTNQFVVTGGTQPVAGVKPTWREATPP